MAELTKEKAWGFNELMVTSAFRYCMGRQTYIVGVCVDWLIDIWPMLSFNTRSIIERDLEREFKVDDDARARNDNYKPLGADCDREDWERLRALWCPVEFSNTTQNYCSVCGPTHGTIGYVCYRHNCPKKVTCT